ncbi:MAG: HEAT repeat domain-containing protein [Chloroflexota bacterium]
MSWLTGSKSVEGRRLVGQLMDLSKRERAAAELLRMGAEAAPALVEALRSPIPGLPPLAGQLLLRLGPTATPALAYSLLNDHPEVRARAAALLAQGKDPQAVPALLQALHGEYYTVRQQAALALGNLRSPQALPALLETFKDPEAEVRAAAAAAVGRYCDPRTFDQMADLLLEDPQLEVRQAAARALGETRHEQAISYLIIALHDSFWWYERESGADVLLNALEAIGKPAVDSLLEALKDPEGAVRRFAAKLLGRIRDPRAIEPLGMALYDMHAEVGQAAAESLAGFGEAGLRVLGEALQHPEAWLRQHAVSGLTLSGDQRIVPVLLGMLDDPEREVVKLVIRSLGKLKDQRALPALQAIAIRRADRELSSLARGAIQALEGSL